MKNTAGLTASNLQGEICTSLILAAFSGKEILVFKYMLPLAFLCLCIFQSHPQWKFSDRVLILRVRLNLTYLEWVIKNYLICFPAIGIMKYATQSMLVFLAFICHFRNRPQCLNPLLYLQWMTLQSPFSSVQMCPSGILASYSEWKTLTLGIF